VLLSAELLPRRRDSAQVVGAALMAHAAGTGHRRIAAALGRPPSTVRNWLRAFRRNAEALRVMGSALYAGLDPNAATIEPASTVIADAIEALACAARAVALRLRVESDPWATINSLTFGQLLAPSVIRT
jgi:transposase-like protein